MSENTKAESGKKQAPRLADRVAKAVGCSETFQEVVKKLGKIEFDKEELIKTINSLALFCSTNDSRKQRLYAASLALILEKGKDMLEEKDLDDLRKLQKYDQGTENRFQRIGSTLVQMALGTTGHKMAGKLPSNKECTKLVNIPLLALMVNKGQITYDDAVTLMGKSETDETAKLDDQETTKSNANILLLSLLTGNQSIIKTPLTREEIDSVGHALRKSKTSATITGAVTRCHPSVPLLFSLVQNEGDLLDAFVKALTHKGKPASCCPALIYSIKQMFKDKSYKEMFSPFFDKELEVWSGKADGENLDTVAPESEAKKDIVDMLLSVVYAKGISKPTKKDKEHVDQRIATLVSTPRLFQFILGCLSPASAFNKKARQLVLRIISVLYKLHQVNTYLVLTNALVVVEAGLSNTKNEESASTIITASEELLGALAPRQVTEELTPIACARQVREGAAVLLDMMCIVRPAIPVQMAPHMSYALRRLQRCVESESSKLLFRAEVNGTPMIREGCFLDALGSLLSAHIPSLLSVSDNASNSSYGSAAPGATSGQARPRSARRNYGTKALTNTDETWVTTSLLFLVARCALKEMSQSIVDETRINKAISLPDISPDPRKRRVKSNTLDLGKSSTFNDLLIKVAPTSSISSGTRRKSLKSLISALSSCTGKIFLSTQAPVIVSIGHAVACIDADYLVSAPTIFMGEESEAVYIETLQGLRKLLRGSVLENNGETGSTEFLRTTASLALLSLPFSTPLYLKNVQFFIEQYIGLQTGELSWKLLSHAIVLLATTGPKCICKIFAEAAPPNGRLLHVFVKDLVCCTDGDNEIYDMVSKTKGNKDEEEMGEEEEEEPGEEGMEALMGEGISEESGEEKGCNPLELSNEDEEEEEENEGKPQKKTSTKQNNNSKNKNKKKSDEEEEDDEKDEERENSDSTEKSGESDPDLDNMPISPGTEALYNGVIAEIERGKMMKREVKALKDKLMKRCLTVLKYSITATPANGMMFWMIMKTIIERGSKTPESGKLIESIIGWCNYIKGELNSNTIRGDRHGVFAAINEVPNLGPEEEEEEEEEEKMEVVELTREMEDKRNKQGSKNASGKAATQQLKEYPKKDEINDILKTSVVERPATPRGKRVTFGKAATPLAAISSLVASERRKSLVSTSVFMVEEGGIGRSVLSLLADTFGEKDITKRMVARSLCSPLLKVMEAAGYADAVYETIGEVLKTSYESRVGIDEKVLRNITQDPYRRSLSIMVLADEICESRCSKAYFEEKACDHLCWLVSMCKREVVEVDGCLWLGNIFDAIFSLSQRVKLEKIKLDSDEKIKGIDSKKAAKFINTLLRHLIAGLKDADKTICKNILDKESPFSELKISELLGEVDTILKNDKKPSEAGRLLSILQSAPNSIKSKRSPK